MPTVLSPPGVIARPSSVTKRPRVPGSEAKTSGSAPPHMRMGRSDPGEGRNKPILYICASNADRTAAILEHVNQAVTKLQSRARVYEFTDHEEFEEHAKHSVSVDDTMYAGICVGLDSQNVSDYFGVMCRLALAMAPNHAIVNDMQIREMRIMATRLMTFGDIPGIPLFIQKGHSAWEDFYYLGEVHRETADDMERVHTQGAQIIMPEKDFDPTIRMRLGMTDPID